MQPADWQVVGEPEEVTKTPTQEREPALISPRSRESEANLQQCQLSRNLPIRTPPIPARQILRHEKQQLVGVWGEAQVSDREEGLLFLPPITDSHFYQPAWRKQSMTADMLITIFLFTSFQWTLNSQLETVVYNVRESKEFLLSQSEKKSLGSRFTYT